MRQGPRRAARFAVATALACTTGAAAQLPRSALAVETPAGWQTWWRAEAPPLQWTHHAPLAGAADWRTLAPGVELAEMRLAGTGQAWRLRLVVARIDPAVLDLRLRTATRERGTLAAWTIDSLSADALLGVNAGQFTGARPWGWHVQDGAELQPPGHGPLSMAIVVNDSGRVAFVSAHGIDSVRAAGGVRTAFQSYPTLLDEGRVPEPLQAEGRGVDLRHRDSRLALGALSDGRLILVLTRFEGLGGVLSELPFGPTVPELAAIMGALGCHSAVALDGGISGQLAIRAADGVRAWQGMRRVPLALELVSGPSRAPAGSL